MNTPIIHRPKSREQWLRLRQKGIGSSEIATLLGYSPYETPYMLWRRKRQAEHETSPENAAMIAGHDMELAVASRFEKETGLRVLQGSAGDWLYQHPDRPYMMASPDRLYWIDHKAPQRGRISHGNQGILECKSTQKPIDPGQVPKHWYLQLQWQMGIGQHREGCIAWYTRGILFGYQHFDFDPLLFDYMTEKAKAFWNECIIQGKEPEPQTSGDLELMWSDKVEGGKSVIADSADLQALESLRKIKEQMRELGERAEQLEYLLKASMKDAEYLNRASGDCLVSWRQCSSQRLDTARLKSEQPQIYEQYAKTSTARRFIIKDTININE